MDTTMLLAIAAVALVGPLAGMSLDQSIKQLPARRHIGTCAYSAYSRAADLRNGLLLYPIFGLGSALMAIAAAISGHSAGLDVRIQLPLDVSGTLAVLHSLTTALAAPINISQRRYALTDEASLERVLNRFERWNCARAVLQTMNLAAALGALVALARHSP